MYQYITFAAPSILILIISYLYDALWRKPENVRTSLRRQGIVGPAPFFVLGNIREMISSQEPEKTNNSLNHDYWVSTIFPFLYRWRNTYGPTFMFTAGNMVSVYVSEPEMMKELTTNTSLDLGPPTMLKSLDFLFGNGVLSSRGHEWLLQRKIIAPEFYRNKVKGMADSMVYSATQLLESWDAKLENKSETTEIRVETELRRFGGDVLSRACFGSNFAQGELIFSKVASMQRTVMVQKLLASLPGMRLIPTKTNMSLWKLASELKCLIHNVVKERNARVEKETDFLQTMIDRENEEGLPNTFLIDNCKTMYLAGEGSAATAAQWVLLLLAYYPQWQSRVRAEVTQVCAGRRPDLDMLGKMNLLTQVIQETLRMYPPAPLLLRQAHRDITLNGLHIPKGTSLWIPAIHYNYDAALWGPDAHEYNPDRFANGVAGACAHPHMYMPFGLGPRTCLGQNFAMTELKILLSMLLEKYEVLPSPNYRHSISHGLVMEPKFGMQLLVRKV